METVAKYWEAIKATIKIKKLNDTDCQKVSKNLQTSNFPGGPKARLKYLLDVFVEESDEVFKKARQTTQESYHGYDPEIWTIRLRELYVMIQGVNPALDQAHKQGSPEKSCPAAKGEIKQTRRFSDISDKEVLELEPNINQYVIGQLEAVHTVATAIRRAKAGLKDSEKPITKLVFSGPTGVGKTYLAKILFESFIQDTSKPEFKRLGWVRIDGSEYKERHEVSKLIGAPPGYIGHDAGGRLTNRVAEAPFSLILWDEIEKMHPAIFDAQLQIFDDGILTDGQGNVVDFNETIHILTSNLGTKEISRRKKEIVPIGQSSKIDSAEKRQILEKKIHDFFPPEWINRIDAFVFFGNPNRAQFLQITELEIKKKTFVLKQNRGIELVYAEDVIEYIYEHGVNPVFGARPLVRCIEKRLCDPLADAILRGEYKEGSEIEALIKGNEIIFRRRT